MKWNTRKSNTDQSLRTEKRKVLHKMGKGKNKTENEDGEAEVIG